MSTLAERYPETLRSLAVDLACSGLTAADVVSIAHAEPGSRRILVSTRDGRTRRAYALDGEGSCGTCDGRGTDPREPGLACIACGGTGAEPAGDPWANVRKRS